jgi:hypothetical protein
MPNGIICLKKCRHSSNPWQNPGPGLFFKVMQVFYTSSAGMRIFWGKPGNPVFAAISGVFQSGCSHLRKKIIF